MHSILKKLNLVSRRLDLATATPDAKVPISVIHNECKHVALLLEGRSREAISDAMIEHYEAKHGYKCYRVVGDTVYFYKRMF